MKFDLHCHSSASDGKLPPHDIVDLAVQSGVQLFSLTDHDTVAGYRQIADKEYPFTLVSGVELSAVWSGVLVHIIGLDFDVNNPQMETLLQKQVEARATRAREIERRLAKKGMTDTLAGALQHCNDPDQIGRPHFAQYLFEKGYVKSVNEAFDKWLGNGKLGDVKSCWPAMESVIDVINAADGVAVLAHPLRYKLTFSKVRRLIDAFADAGGQAVEVVGQQAKPDQLQQLCQYVRIKQLAGSGGSDFHDPQWQWAQLGEVKPLPADIKPVWQLFQHTLI